jgi:hypothetical protein
MFWRQLVAGSAEVLCARCHPRVQGTAFDALGPKWNGGRPDVPRRRQCDLPPAVTVSCRCLPRSIWLSESRSTGSSPANAQEFLAFLKTLRARWAGEKLHAVCGRSSPPCATSPWAAPTTAPLPSRTPRRRSTVTGRPDSGVSEHPLG